MAETRIRNDLEQVGLGDVSLEELVERAHEAIADLCSGKRKWIMHIPVMPDDCDILLSYALRAQTARIEELEAQLGIEHDVIEYDDACPKCGHYLEDGEDDRGRMTEFCEECGYTVLNRGLYGEQP